MSIPDHSEAGRRSQSLLIFSAALTALTFVVELVVGLWTNSVALLSDAGHVFTDLTALAFSLGALRLAFAPATSRRTFGLHRLEVLAAFLNGVLVAGMSVALIIESASRLQSPPVVKSGPMLAAAVFGLVVNLLVAWRLHGFSAIDINMRGAFVHVLSDALASLGVVLGGLLVFFTGWLVADPLVGLAVALIIAVNALRLLKESVHILLEGTPGEIHLDEVSRALQGLSGVAAVDDLHVWSICSHITSLSVHLILKPEAMAQQRQTLESVHNLLRNKFNIRHATVQIHASDWPPLAGDSSHSPSR